MWMMPVKELKNLTSAMRKCEGACKICLLVGIFAAALFHILLAVCYTSNLNSSRFDRFKFSFETHSNDASVRPNITKTIFFWKTTFPSKTFYLGDGDLFRNCAGVAKNCWATHKLNSSLNIEDFDAVLFHGYHSRAFDLPETRRERQNYIFVNLESPECTKSLHSRFDKNFFNLTMTYQLNSDIIWNYRDILSSEDGSVVSPRLETVWNTKTGDATDLKDSNTEAISSSWNESTMKKMRRNKTKTAAWLVSDCHPMSKREKYVKELAKHVDIDIYGKCGNRIRCPRVRDCFHEVIEPNYYFYLSFENSMCQDYVTEKFYNALKYNVVPIVYGGANYSLFGPPRSYINALDFDSPKELAIFLKRLIAQPSEYEKYFEWKKSYMIVGAHHRVACQLCQYLHENSKTQSYSSFSAWFGSKQCPLQKKLKKVPYLTRKDLEN